MVSVPFINSGTVICSPTICSDKQEMASIFDLRHYPLSDGNYTLHFGKVLDFKWSNHSYACAEKKKEQHPKCCENLLCQRGRKSKSKPRIYDLNDAQIKAMIEEFDSNLDSVVTFEDFKHIMEI